MTIPNDTVLQDAIDDVIPLGFLSGTSTDIALAAMETAWDLAERGLSTGILITGTSCEVYDRPTGHIDYNERFGFLQLQQTNLVSIESVTILHDKFACDCVDQEVAGCAHVYNSLFGHIRVEDCYGPCECACAATGRPSQIQVCYMAGLWNTLADVPRSVLIALGLIAQWYAEVMETSGEQASTAFVSQWSSMDYSESYDFLEKNIIGTSPQLALAWNNLRRYKTRRGVAMRSYLVGQPGR